MKAMPAFSGSRRACVRSTPEVRFGVDRRDRLAVELAVRLGAVVLADEADVDVRAREDPRLVRAGEEDVAGLLDPLEDPAVRAAADRLRRQQAGAPRRPCLDLPPAPSRASSRQKSAHARQAVVEDVEQGLDVVVAEAAPQQLAAQERRIADDELRLRPLGLARVRRVGEVEQRVAGLDVVERAQDRVAAVAQAVADHPLDLADPDGHPGELGGVGVDLDAEDRLGADLGDLHRALEDERAPVDGLELEVLEGPQGDDQEVAASRRRGRARGRAAGARGSPRRRPPGSRSRGVAFVTFLPDRSSSVTRACMAAYSRRSGRRITGSTRPQIASRSV